MDRKTDCGRGLTTIQVAAKSCGLEADPTQDGRFRSRTRRGSVGF